MADANIDNRTLLKRTLVTAGAMVGSCVVLVGTLTLIVNGIVSHAVSPASEETASGGSGAALVPAGNVHGGMPGAPPMAGGRQMPVVQIQQPPK
ncbi:MAG TPA: hypothetical protein VF765_09780 [Polyangiaceae bacterium]